MDRIILWIKKVAKIYARSIAAHLYLGAQQQQLNRWGLKEKTV